MPPVIEVRDLSVRFGPTVAIDGLSLEVHAGEIVALVGHNGAGKTTALRALNGLVEPAAGSLRVLGLCPLQEGSALRRRVAVLTETSSLDERLSARETLETFADLYDLPVAGRRESLTALLRELGLEDRIDTRVAAFSKGMRQRLALARALVHTPELLYLDEPTSGLDPAAARLVHRLVRHWAREEGRTVVLSTHNLAEAQELADRVALLAHGRLIAMGTPSDLSRRAVPSPSLILEVHAADVGRARESLPRNPRLVVHAAEDGRLTVLGALREDVPELVALLVAAGVRLYRVAQQEPSLEDAYFALQSAEPQGAGT